MTQDHTTQKRGARKIQILRTDGSHDAILVSPDTSRNDVLRLVASYAGLLNVAKIRFEGRTYTSAKIRKILGISF